MKVMSIRDLRNHSKELQKVVPEENVVLTSNGRPFALIIDAGDDPAELEQVVRQARAQLAVSRLRREAAESGSATMSDADVDAEIRAARATRNRS